MRTVWHISPDSPAIHHLTAVDSDLGDLIARAGAYDLTLRGDYYGSLIRSVIGQQLSTQVARTIWQRMVDGAGGDVTPSAVSAIDDGALRCMGLSWPKVEYVRHITRAVQSGALDLAALEHRHDDDIMAALTAVKGVGRWTAQMFLIFSLGRPDVLATGDLGLRRAAQWLYRLDDMPDEKELGRRGEPWRPYRTVASLYLWESVNRNWTKDKRL